MLTLNQQKLIRWIDANAKQQQYGTFTLTLLVKDGDPVNKSARMTKIRRKKYKIPIA